MAAVVGAGDRSLKAQMRHAGALGVSYAAIMGERELADGSVTLKDLLNGTQDTIPMAEVAGHITSSSPG